MKTFFFLLFITTIFADETPAHLGAGLAESKSILMIDPKARSSDYQNAFDLLRKDKPTMKIAIRTTNGLLQNVTDLSVAPGGTILYVKTLSTQGSRFQLVPIEEMLEISYSP